MRTLKLAFAAALVAAFTASVVPVISAAPFNEPTYGAKPSGCATDEGYGRWSSCDGG